jgi:hypothetical protein
MSGEKKEIKGGKSEENSPLKVGNKAAINVHLVNNNTRVTMLHITIPTSNIQD